MAHKSVLLRTVLFIALSLPSSFAIKCFICNSATQPNCAKSPPPSEYLLECSKDTLEVLNDYHRQKKLEDVAAAVVEKKGEDGVKLHDHSHHDHSISHDAHEHESGHDHKEHSLPSSFDSDDKELTLNRTSRGAEGGMNKTEAKPVPSVANPVKLPREASFCRTTSYHIPKQENGPNSTLPKSVRVIRSCGWIAEERAEGEPMKTGCKWIGTDGVQMDQCVCTGDGCNPASVIDSLKVQTLLLTSIMSVGYFYLL